MKCPKCNNDVSFVICPYCGINVIHYSKYKTKENKESELESRPETYNEVLEFMEDIFRNE